MTYDVQRYCLCWICEAMVKWNEPCHEERVTNASYGEWVIAADAEAHEAAAVEAAHLLHMAAGPTLRALTREQAIRDAANEAALALIAMDGIEFTPEQHNSVVDAIHALLEGMK